MLFNTENLKTLQICATFQPPYKVLLQVLASFCYLVTFCGTISLLPVMYVQGEACVFVIC